MESTDIPRINSSMLPDISMPEMDFYDSSFFRAGGLPMPQLPTPTTVREACKRDRLKIVKFEDLNLVVKFGGASLVRLEEAQTMRAIKQIFPNNEVTVPEVFGWRVDQGENFIYMSLIRGITLRDGWPLLTQADKESICDQLGRTVAALKRIRLDSSDPFIGSISCGVVQDIYFRAGNEAGPFPSVEKFNDWVQFVALSWVPMSDRPPDPYRGLLSDTGNICFTHGDLNLGNIIISGTRGSQRIEGIIDWEQAGWYPEYWEYCKLLIAEPWMHEWRNSGWTAKVMKPYPDEWTAFSEYWMWLRP